MSLGARDAEAFDLLRSRRFDDVAVAAFDLEMSARRVTLRLYGRLRADDAATYAGTVTFFGAAGVRVDNAAGAFPESARAAALSLAYDDETDRGTVEVRGREPWTLGWTFDGLAYEEHAAVLASLADD